MRAFPPAPPGAVRLTVDEGALVIGLLDFLVEPAMRASPDVIGLAQRTRSRVSAALATAMNNGRSDLDSRLERLRDEFLELQVAFQVQSQKVEETLATAAELRGIVDDTRTLMGDSGGVTIDGADERLRTLRAELARVAA